MIGLLALLAEAATLTACVPPDRPELTAVPDFPATSARLRPGSILWSWNPRQWTLQAAKPPEPGTAAAMAVTVAGKKAACPRAGDKTPLPVQTLAKRLRLEDQRLARPGAAGWLTVNVYYRWMPGGSPLLASQRLALWVNGYSAAYRESRFDGPSGQAFVHAVSVPADRIGTHGGVIDMLLTAQIESRGATPATLIIDRIDVVCATKACRR